MVMQIGQDADDDALIRARHDCWHCGYSEMDRDWSRPLRTDGQSLLERIRDRIRGVEVPMVYDRTPSTVEAALAEAEEAL